MSFSEFFGRKGAIHAPERGLPMDAALPPAPSGLPSAAAAIAENCEIESCAEAGARIGGDNEALRNLLVDAGQRIGALDDFKDAFSKLVDPIQKTLRSLEIEKSENVSLKGMLADIRNSHDALRIEFSELGRRSAANGAEVERLRQELDTAQQAARASEIARAEVTDELAGVRARLAEAECNYAQEAANTSALNEEKLTLTNHGATADKRIIELEGKTSQARERLVLLENEKRALQNSHDQFVGENARLLRRANESDAALSAARLRLEQIETSLAAVGNERDKLACTVDEAHERRRVEANTLNMRLEAMQSRATAAERLLGEVRQSLLSRTEENRLSERKVVETTIERNAIEKKLEQLLTSLQGQERQIRDLESSRSMLVERSNTLAKIVKTRETALGRADENAQAMADRVAQLDADAEANRVRTERQTEELSSALQRERLERAVAEGALEATRKNYIELQRELAKERLARRDHGKPEAGMDGDARSAKAKAAKPGEIGPTATGRIKPIIAS